MHNARRRMDRHRARAARPEPDLFDRLLVVCGGDWRGLVAHRQWRPGHGHCRGRRGAAVFGSLKAWEALHTLATIDADDPSASCKPFSKNRSGMVLGEGAAMLVLEPWDSAVARGATIHGEMLGYGLSTDVGHITRPSVEGQAAAMRAALQSARLEPAAQVDAINAHGTGTLANDAVETAAIKAVFGGARASHPDQRDQGDARSPAGRGRCARMRVVVAGHAACGACRPCTCSSPIPRATWTMCPTWCASVAVRTMLSNSFAFGGTNAVLVLRGSS